jgi:hypothetical protein
VCVVGTYVDNDRVLRVVCLLGEVLGAEVGPDEVDLHGTLEAIDVHVYDLLDFRSVDGIGNENIYWAGRSGDSLNVASTSEAFEISVVLADNFVSAYLGESFSASDKPLAVLEVIITFLAPD